MARFDLRLDELRIEGSSRAGDRTWFRVHPPGLAFDVGRGAGALTGASDIFLSHGHLDHALGLPFVLSNRALQGLAPTRVFCPRPVVAAVERFVAAAEALEEARYDYELRGLDPGEDVAVGRDLRVEAFAVEHGVPALGFHLLRRRRRLKAAYRALTGVELGARRRAGEEIEEESEEVWVSYCGDTGSAVFDLEPRVFDATVLLIECTFLADEARASAGRFGHLHLAELAARADRFANQAIVLHHLTHRHELAELEQAVGELPAGLAERIRWVGVESAGERAP